ncbi:MAG: prepilin-type N-terminal cleavage/methylation domain-containing protein [Patescibacteria group bacterium]
METITYDLKNYQKRLSRGFTLIELLVYIGVLAVIMLVLTNTVIALNRGWGRVVAQSEVNANMRVALDKIGKDIKSASAVVTPASAGASASSLSLTIGSDTVTYCITSGQLRREPTGSCTASSPVVTASSITMTSATFVRLENTNTTLSKTIYSIQMTLNAQYAGTSPDRQYSSTKQTTIDLP